MFTSLAIGASLLCAFVVIVLFGLTLSVIFDATSKPKEAAETFWQVVVWIIVGSPLCGLAVILWHHALS